MHAGARTGLGTAVSPSTRPRWPSASRTWAAPTGYLGKVHYGQDGAGDAGAPPHHGFDTTYYGVAGQQKGRLNYLRHCAAAVAEYGQFGATTSAVQPMLEGETEVELEGFLTDELGVRVRAFVSENAADGQPFFLMLAFNAVHNFCWQLPAEELEKRNLPTHPDYRDGSEDYLGRYDGQVSPNLEHDRENDVAQLELMDRKVAGLLESLEEQGIADDTVVVYLRDNGGSNCNFADNTPLRGTKYTLWDGGIRVPCLLRWPGGGIPA